MLHAPGQALCYKTAMTPPQRIAKAMARAGLCSRREAERWIGDGRVRVNGEVLTTPAVTVSADDRIEVDGKPVAPAMPARLWRYHKPAGLVTSNADPQGRPTVFDRLPKSLPRVISVGRLDLNTEGLLLLTNDGELARRLELPATGWTRRYRVRAHGRITPETLRKLAGGITLDGFSYAPIEAKIEHRSASNVWLAIALSEGKNREIRRVLESLGLTVNRLIRTSFGPFQLGTLARGDVDEVPQKVLGEQLGGQIAGRTNKPRSWARTKGRKNAHRRRKS